MYLIVVFIKEKNVLNHKNPKCFMENMCFHAQHFNHLRYQIIYANSDRKNQFLEMFTFLVAPMKTSRLKPKA